MKKVDQINQLIRDYSLHPEEVYIDQKTGLKIIRRTGYKKIQAKKGIVIDVDCQHSTHDSAVVKAHGELTYKDASGKPVTVTSTALGEASPLNNKFPYPVSVAQKRAEGRLILDMAGLYAKGFYTEDEIDERIQSDKRKVELEKKAQDSIKATEEKLGIG